MRIMLKTLNVENWRKLHNLNPLHIGKKITLISGQNGVGKSNLLSLLASGSGTSKPKKFISANKSFQPEFYDFFKIDPNENFSEYSVILEYSVEGHNSIYKGLRAKNDLKSQRGIRIIPTTRNYNNNFPSKKEAQEDAKNRCNIGNDARVPIPTLFLSISRLYPVGEGNTETKNIRPKFPQMYEKYQEWYNFVLPDSISNNEGKKNQVIEIDKDTINAKSYYLPLNDALPLTQSVGQDNLGCIISALVNFYGLSLDENYNGGILCIDEVDVSLHPDAQERLIQLLDRLSSELKLQIIISSHSLVIIKDVLKLAEGNPDNYSVGYLINNRNPFFKQNLSYDIIKKDLFLIQSVYRPSLKVYFEDDKTEELFNLLKDTYISVLSDEYDLNDSSAKNEDVLINNSQLCEIPVHLGCNQLLQLVKSDSYFKSVLIVVDGDASTDDDHKMKWDDADSYLESEEHTCQGKEPFPSNVLSLPTIFCPEFFLYRIIYSLSINEEMHTNFWRQIAEYPDLDLNTPQLVRENLILSNLSKGEVKNESEKLFKFAKQSGILKYYYSQQQHKDELRTFMHTFNVKAKGLLIKLKSQCYRD